MADSTQKLKTDATLAELRAAAPRDEGELATSVGAVWWLGSAVVLLIGTFVLPDPLTPGLGYWRIGGLLLGTVMAASHLTWMRLLSRRALNRALFGSVLLASTVNLLMMLVSPVAVEALTINLLPGVMFAAYFLSGRQTAAVVFQVTVFTIVPVIYNFDASTATRMTSRLTVWMPVVWLIGLAIHMQNRQRRNAIDQAERQAFIDPLTGIDNLRALRERAARAFAVTPPDGRVTALLLIDVDELKEFNTFYGHAAGDNLLRRVARALARAASSKHEVVRVSGDMFAVLIEDIAAEDLEAMTQRYRAAVRSAAEEEAMPELRLDAGIGVAVFPTDGDSFEQLMTAADRSLYAAKRVKQSVREPIAPDRPPAEPAQPRRALDEDEAPPKTISVTDTEEPVFLGRPLHALSAAIGWYLAISLVMLSLAMPDADRSRLNVVLPLSFALLVPATLNFFFTPPIGSRRHLVNDMITLAVIAVVTYLTGGSNSAAWALVFIFLIHEGWFMSARQLAPRFFAIAVVIVLPLIYENVGSGATRAATIATLYMALIVALEQTLAMGLNRTYVLRAENVARRLAALDPLTGLPNRQAFDRLLSERLASLRYRDVDELAIVMLDLDGFKRVNAEFGHGAGDALLCRIADALRGTTRGEDLVARIGADEFAAVMPTSDENDARTLAERLVRATDRCVADSPDITGAKITARAGFSLYPTHGRTPDDLVSAAELALLTVKAGGRPSRVSRIVVGL